ICVSFSEAIMHCVEGDRTVQKCLKCEIYYTPTVDYLNCSICEEAIENCLYCSQTEFKCLSCKHGYTVSSNGSCISCTSQNSDCVSPQIGSCQYGLSLFDNYCYDCISEIDDCVLCDPTQWGCSKCISEKTLFNGICVDCNITNCNKCSTDSYECELCQTGYYILNGICVLICDNDNNCLECNGEVCSKCRLPYVLNENFKCVQCVDNENISKCIRFENVCDYEYFPNNNYCWETSIYFDNCHMASRTTYECVLCDEGYGLNTLNQCERCEYGCLSCSFNSTFCVSCVTGFSISNGKCFIISKKDCDIYNMPLGCESCANLMYPIEGRCLSCEIDNCDICKEESCLKCSFNKTTTETPLECVQQTVSHYNYYLNINNTCEECPLYCNSCVFINNQIRCKACAINHTLSEDSTKCELKETHCEISYNGYCYTCQNGSTIKNGICSLCTQNCEKCNYDGCDICKQNYLIVPQTKECLFYDKCTEINDNICTTCSIELYKTGDQNSMCENCSTYCEYCSESLCLKCRNEYYLSDTSTCEVDTKQNRQLMQTTKTTLTSNCAIVQSVGCIRCDVGYYLYNSKCVNCPSHCRICYSPNECAVCDINYTLQGISCELLNTENGCQTFQLNKIKCAICLSGYVMNREGNCEKCHLSCDTCIKDSTICLTCAEHYFMNNSRCVSTTQIANCVTAGSHTCLNCSKGYYLNQNGFCTKCHPNCLSCDSETVCTSCFDNFVFSMTKCVDMVLIQHCTSAKNGLCVTCENGFILKNNFCKEKTKIWVYIVILFSIILLIIIIISIIILPLYFIFKKHKNTEEKTIFKMERSNLIFTSLDSVLSSNKKLIDFDNIQIPVNKETRELLCLGNKSKHHIKLQLSVITDERVTIQINPQIVVLKNGEACEFEILVTPNCTCKISSLLKLIYIDFKTAKETVF
ncbi:tyrosine kinase, putative, partial [Entamoeba invadens IP1]